MGLKAYFDSSRYDGTSSEKDIEATSESKGDKKYQKVLTLSGFAATETVWCRFEPDWKRVLDKYNISSFHMTDAMRSKGIFKGWDKAKVNSLVKDLFNIIGKYRSEELMARSCSVLLEEYDEAKRDIPNLRPAEAICVDFCIGGLWIPSADINSPEPCISLYFDKNEPFLHQINRVWVNARSRSKTKGWPKQVKRIESAGSKTTVALQAADMYALIVNRFHRGYSQPEFHYVISHLMASHYTEIYDYQRIKAKYATG